MAPPRPTGPHAVGVADVAQVLHVGPDSDDATPRRIAGRMFYPCLARRGTAPVLWIPALNYARGYVGYMFKMLPANQQGTLKTRATKAALTGLAWALGASRVLPLYYAAEAVAGSERLPVVVFSHGLAGTRNAYSAIASELASYGYVVLALEHGDGSASTSRLPREPRPGPSVARRDTSAEPAPATVATAQDHSSSSSSSSSGRGAGGLTGSTANGSGGADGNGSNDSDTHRNRGGSASGSRSAGSEWLFYQGLGAKPEQMRKVRYRVAEVQAAMELLEAIDAGGSPRGCTACRTDPGRLEGVLELPRPVAASLRGRLDRGRAAVMGHSYGGATAAAAAAQLSCFKAAICLDPWWDCFDDAWPVVTRWASPTPLLVIGSHDWNTPNAEGKLKCGGVNQERVLAAAAAGGGGAVMVVPQGSTHFNYDDVALFFGGYAAVFGIRSQLEPQLAHKINIITMRTFLQRFVQTPRPPPLVEADLEPHRATVGAWAAILRVVPAVQQ